MQKGKLKGSRPSDKRPGVSGRRSTEVLVLNTAYEREIKGGNLRIPVPSVIRLKYYIKPIFREAYPIICDSFLNPANLRTWSL